MKYKKINSYTFIGNDCKTVKVIINGTYYKTCSLCGRYFPATGHNVKYCPLCRRKANSINTSLREKRKIEKQRRN